MLFFFFLLEGKSTVISVLDATGGNVKIRARARTHTAARIHHASESVQTCFLIPSACHRTVLQVRCSLIGLQNAAQPRSLLPPNQIHRLPPSSAAVLAAETPLL